MNAGMGSVGQGQGLGPLEGASEDAAAPAVVSPGAEQAEAAPARGAAPGGRMAALAAVTSQAADPRLEPLLEAMRTQPADQLEETIAAAKASDPTLYRSAVRSFFKEIGFSPSALMAHNMAMDANNDGWLTFSESYSTMRDMGFTRTRAALLSGLTAVALAPQTTEEFSLKLNVANSDKTERAFFRTGFDTDEALEGRLDELMAEDLDGDGFLVQADFDRLIDKRTATMDSKLGAKLINYLNKSEWQGLLSLMDSNRISRDELRDFYDSSLFFSLLEPANLAQKLIAYRSAGT